jgi:hypothetical protein
MVKNILEYEVLGSTLHTYRQQMSDNNRLEELGLPPTNTLKEINMYKIRFALRIITLVTFACAFAAVAQAQATRTWVSGVGDDVNPCSRTAPCKTFAGAISKTAAGGEINALDPGGFGAVTITKSMAIVADYTEGGVLAGGNGIVVNALSTDKVYLSGLDVKGVNPPTTGIRILSAASVIVKNCSVRDYVTGIVVDPASGTTEVSLIDSTVANNTGTGISIRPTGSGTVRMNVERSRMINNAGDGLIANATAPTTGTIHVTVRDSDSSHNGATGFAVLSGGVATQMMLDGCNAINNANGIAANGSGAIVRFARSSVTRNTTGVIQVGAGLVQSYSPATNLVDGNGTDGTFGTTPFK